MTPTITHLINTLASTLASQPPAEQDKALDELIAALERAKVCGSVVALVKSVRVYRAVWG